MKVHRVVITVLLGVVGWHAHLSNAWAVIKQYIELEREMKLYLDTPTETRTSEPVFKALRAIARNCPHSQTEKLFGHLMHYPWMMTDDANRQDGPATSNRVMETAKEWACACLADSMLTSVFGRGHSERWLDWDGESLESQEVHEALALDIKDTIARFHEATQVEIALSLGENDQVVGPKYVELVQMCMPGYS